VRLGNKVHRFVSEISHAFRNNMQPTHAHAAVGKVAEIAHQVRAEILPRKRIMLTFAEDDFLYEYDLTSHSTFERTWREKGRGTMELPSNEA